MFRLEWTSDGLGRVQSAVTEKGEVVTELLGDGKQVEAGFVEALSTKAKIGDVAHSISRELLVSRRIMSVLEEFQIEPAITRTPITVMNGDQVVGEGYTLLQSLSAIDVLDREYAKYELIGDYLFDVSNWVLKKEEIPDFDLFRALPGDWMLSVPLGEALKSVNITGVKLEPVEVR